MVPVNFGVQSLKIVSIQAWWDLQSCFHHLNLVLVKNDRCTVVANNKENFDEYGRLKQCWVASLEYQRYSMNGRRI